MSQYEYLTSINLQGSLNESAPRFSVNSVASLSEGSWNCITNGDGLSRAFEGCSTMGANTGTRKSFVIGKTWGGIKDIGLVTGSGSFFEDIGRSRWGIGAGQPAIEGVDVSGFTLSTNLQVSISSGGVYSAPVEAGLSQPSAPDIGIVQSAGDVSNSISVKIERRRPSTGARSLASPTSVVAVPTSNRIRVTFPLAVAGQTHWRAYFTFQGFGGTGIHYLALYGSDSDISETIVAAGTVDGIARSLEFNYKDGDLVPLEASYDDYAPPAATHALKLQTVVNLGGCYSDTASPTSTNTGTAIAVSKINNYESYVPTHLLFLPEQIVDMLARPIDDYGYVACENSIHAIQYVGYRGDELPPCTITTVLPDIGIQYPHNWTHFRGQLLIYSAEGNLLWMKPDGSFDTVFASPITKIIKNWNPANTIVGYDPKNDLLIVANGKRILVFSLAKGIWRQIWLPDYGVSGTVTSCTTAKRRLYISISNGSAVTAYSFDTANADAPLSFVSQYQNAPSGNAGIKDLFEMAVSAESASNTSFIACINKNLSKTAFRQIVVTSGSDTVLDSESSFSPDMLGKKVCIFADDIGGSDIDYILGSVYAFNGISGVSLIDSDGNPLNPFVSGADLLMFCGEFIEAEAINNAGEHFPNFFPNVSEARSYQTAFWMKGKAELGNVLTADLFGVQYASSRAI